MCPINPDVFTAHNSIGKWSPIELPDTPDEPTIEPHNMEPPDALPEELGSPEGLTCIELLKAIDDIEHKMHSKWRPRSDLYNRGLKRLALLDNLLEEKLSREKI